ncbi:hypothetical protein ACFOHK_20515 [Falsigemmobacter intermedius]|nr:hypothetical protein [Falsigemmobacter intermedius]
MTELWLIDSCRAAPVTERVSAAAMKNCNCLKVNAMPPPEGRMAKKI